jgi:hypothetical protein
VRASIHNLICKSSEINLRLQIEFAMYNRALVMCVRIIVVGARLHAPHERRIVKFELRNMKMLPAATAAWCVSAV